jgi:hypothetical protein
MGNSPITFLNNEPASLLITIDRIPCRIVSDSTDGSPASGGRIRDSRAFVVS